MKKTKLLFFLTGTLFMMVVMVKTGSTLKTGITPLGILDLEFAYNTSKTAVVLQAWAPTTGYDNITAAKINTWWDFVFLFFYTGFLFLACKRIIMNNKGWFAKAGHWVATGALTAGMLDVLENAGMLITLNGKSSSGIALCTTLFAVVKWILALVAVLYVLAGLLVWAYRKSRQASGS